MALGGLLFAVLCAGALGWIGRPVLVLLPDPADAPEHAPTNRAIARAPRLCWWLSGTAATLIVVVTFAAPLFVLPAWILVCGVGTWLAYSDWRTRRLPLHLMAPIWGVTLAVVLLEAWLASDIGILLRAVTASAAAAGLYWTVAWFAARRRQGSFGLADVRFAALVGLVLGSVGFKAALVGLALGLVVAAVIGVVRQTREQDLDFAFGPAILAGAVLGLLFT
jgi:leader peptidase (prepilin peptidase)/N-methyltransferase